MIKTQQQETNFFMALRFNNSIFLWSFMEPFALMLPPHTPRRTYIARLMPEEAAGNIKYSSLCA